MKRLVLTVVTSLPFAACRILIFSFTHRHIEPQKALAATSTQHKKHTKAMKWKELIPESAWVVDDLLTKEECEYFIQQAKDLGIQDMVSAGDVRHRNSTTVSLDEKKK